MKGGRIMIITKEIELKKCELELQVALNKFKSFWIMHYAPVFLANNSNNYEINSRFNKGFKNYFKYFGLVIECVFDFNKEFENSFDFAFNYCAYYIAIILLEKNFKDKKGVENVLNGEGFILAKIFLEKECGNKGEYYVDNLIEFAKDYHAQFADFE